MILTIQQCARCGGSHPNLDFKAFASPNPTYKWWALCPKTKEPILLREAEHI